MDKAPDAFRTISEVADELDLPQHVLRFWETRFTQIKPLKRGGGRRYYRPDDVVLLRGIRYLLYGEGYTIKGVQRILKDSGVRAVQEIWQAKLASDDVDETDPARPVEVSVQLPPQIDHQPLHEGIEEPVDDLPQFEEEPAMAVAAVPEPEPEPATPVRAGYVAHANVSIVRGGIPRAGADAAAKRSASQSSVGTAVLPGLSGDDVQTLKAVLYELLETRKGLDLALSRR